MAACVNFSGADTLRERVWGEFAELSPGGERAGTAEGRRGWGERDRSLATRVTPPAGNLLGCEGQKGRGSQGLLRLLPPTRVSRRPGGVCTESQRLIGEPGPLPPQAAVYCKLVRK